MKVLQQEQAQCITVGSKRGGGGVSMEPKLKSLNVNN